MQRSSIVGNNLTKITVPGNGDCFYHSVMIGIICDVLTDKLSDHLPTAARIQTILLPEIARQLAFRGKPLLDFSSVGLKQAILELLRTVPIAELGVPQQCGLILPLDDADSQEVRVIKNCDLYHLLVDICSPAMRNIMLSGMQEYKDSLEPVIKELFRSEFSSFMLVEHGTELGVDSSTLAAAKNQLSGGELYDVDSGFRLPLCDSWHRSFPAVSSYFINNKNIDTSINAIFESWWRLNRYQVCVMYQAIHRTPRIMAGQPQQIALSSKLFCNFKILNRSNDNHFSLAPAVDQQHSLLFCNLLSHVDFVASETVSNHIVSALQERMDSFQCYREVINRYSYPWAMSAMEAKNEQDNEAVAMTFVAVERYSACKILYSAMSPAAFWNPMNYLRVVTETPPDQRISRAADTASPRPSFSLQPDVD